MLKNSEISTVGHAAVDHLLTTREPSSSNVELARFLNLREITSQRGSKTRLAEHASLNPSVISHILKRRYAMSDEVAHKIESTFELRRGFLDHVRAVHEYPEPMRRFLRVSESGPVSDALHLSSFGLGDTSPHAGNLSVTEFESLPSLKLTGIDWTLHASEATSPAAERPLCRALCSMINQKIKDGTLTEALAFKLIEVLVDFK